MNAVSEKLGRKDIIKIENNLELDFTVLGFIDPNITIDIIKDEKIYKKIKLKLPDKIENIIECKNPRCVTSVEKNIPHIFNLVDEKTGAYRCEYCDQIYENLSKYL